MDDNSGAKERIMETVVNLLLTRKDVGKITNRQIAAMAGVNSALINYYYQSKENLVNKAAEICMESMAGELSKRNDETAPPAQRLKNMIKAISTFAFDNYELSSIFISSEIKSGSLNTSRTILPLLKELFAQCKSELELKIMALQIIAPLQIIFLHAKEYKEYLSEDIYDEEKRNEFLDNIVDNIL